MSAIKNVTFSNQSYSTNFEQQNFKEKDVESIISRIFTHSAYVQDTYKGLKTIPVKLPINSEIDFANLDSFLLHDSLQWELYLSYSQIQIPTEKIQKLDYLLKMYPFSKQLSFLIHRDLVCEYSKLLTLLNDDQWKDFKEGISTFFFSLDWLLEHTDQKDQDLRENLKNLLFHFLKDKSDLKTLIVLSSPFPNVNSCVSEFMEQANFLHFAHNSTVKNK